MAAISSELERETTDIMATDLKRRIGTNSSNVRVEQELVHGMKI